MTNDERSIRELVATWLAASKNGDLPAVLELMTDDVIFMVSGSKPFGKGLLLRLSKAWRKFALRDAAIFRSFKFSVIGRIYETISR